MANTTTTEEPIEKQLWKAAPPHERKPIARPLSTQNTSRSEKCYETY